MSEALKIHHSLGDIEFTPAGKINAARLKKVMRTALDQYLEEDRVPAAYVHAQAKKRHGAYYQTPGYYLRMYRQRKEYTQAVLAEKAQMLQHHVSEMENNKRPIGKAAAKKFAKLLKCDYKKLL